MKTMRIIVMELGMLKRSRLIVELSFGRVSFCVVFSDPKGAESSRSLILLKIHRIDFRF